jgi:hypothetical protein
MAVSFKHLDGTKDVTNLAGSRSCSSVNIALHSSTVLIQAHVRALEKAVDNIDNASPAALQSISVGHVWTSNVCTSGGIGQKPPRKLQDPPMLGVNGRSNTWIKGSMKGQVLVSQRIGGAHRRNQCLGHLLMPLAEAFFCRCHGDELSMGRAQTETWWL